AFGDPAIVADRTSDEGLIIAVAGCTVYANGNTTRQNPNMIATILSKDNGETWEEPINVTEDIYSLFDSGNVVQSAFVGGGKVFQSRIVKKDKYYRLYAAMCARPNGNRVIYSDDFGKTWHALGGASALPAPGGDEPKCEELPDGRVILSSRVGGGRIYNIYTYSNTLTGAGAWSTDVKSTFAGSGLVPGGNSTNGEILVVPVQRNSDGKEMYLALQSLPTGGGRTNVSIFYKELTDFSDLNSVANFADDWNGYYQVSNTSSAYSSMDLQADNRIGFIYEETLTGFGRRDNPVSTSFPTGAGQHNFDGFDNIYVAYDLEYITGGAYSIKRDVDRRAFVRNYFNALADDVDMSAGDRKLLESALDKLSEQPTPKEIDAVYAVFSGGVPADKWDGKTLTFTNVQQSGAERLLYINNNNVLDLSTSPASEVGDAAHFVCKKEDSGKYSFFNEKSGLYMIWRAGNSGGSNNNSGILATYNATYCDWSINQGSVADTYYIVSKRSDGATDGSLIVMASGSFDAYSATEGYTGNFSNLFRIDVINVDTA
ncbi:MAG: exo-alpha-sialidase, partial [Bacteroidaceae bacterium]|nr:exo-alpha-sialidase [Bacteroidaceae bacterium]